MYVVIESDMVGEVPHPVASTSRASSEAISDAGIGDTMAAYAALSAPSPTSPPISKVEPMWT